MANRHDGQTSADDGAMTLARGLGWFSIALGAAELLAGKTLARSIGMEDQTGVLRAYGLREIGTGIGILSQDDPTPWIWGRVAGDVLDLATLATGLDSDNQKRGGLGLAIGAVGGVTILDVLCLQALRSEPEPQQAAAS